MGRNIFKMTNISSNKVKSKELPWGSRQSMMKIHEKKGNYKVTCCFERFEFLDVRFFEMKLHRKNIILTFK